MKETKVVMGMPITVEIVDAPDHDVINRVFDYFKEVDEQFSPYKNTSELTRVNEGLSKSEWSEDMQEVMQLSNITKQQTNGYFNVEHHGKIDPSGLVKGWAIERAAKIISGAGFQNYYIEAGGDIEVSGMSAEKTPWVVGIRNPFNTEEIVKVVHLSNRGIATSGTYIRGEHIYNPHESTASTNPVRSLTVIGPNIYEADRFATAAFAMGEGGVHFIENLPGFEAYSINDQQIATLTTGFTNYVSETV